MGMMNGFNSFRGHMPPAPSGQRWLGQPSMQMPRSNEGITQPSGLGGVLGGVSAADRYAPGLMSRAPNYGAATAAAQNGAVPQQNQADRYAPGLMSPAPQGAAAQYAPGLMSPAPGAGATPNPGLGDPTAQMKALFAQSQAGGQQMQNPLARMLMGG